MSRLASKLALTLAALVLAGCAALPAPVERPASLARSDVADTALARIAAASTPPEADALSGFRLLPDGSDALAARIALIRRAEKTIDVQYYLIAADRTGLQFLTELSAAAARGVRVRVLVDDLYAIGEDALFAGLAGRRNVEVRLFNPLPARRGGFTSRVAFSLQDFPRINHRMHNKLLIADGTFAITGGRNIADAYFGRGSAANFVDMDLLSSGPVVAGLAAVFDDFWNSPHAYPVASLARASADAVDAALATLPAPGARAMLIDGEGGAVLATELALGRVALRFAPARVLADAPAQVVASAPRRGDSAVMRAHLELLASARSNVLIATPYFVPGADGMAALREARGRDVSFVVMTNSLATTDEPLVHYRYARYRVGLLRLGVALHELMPLPRSTDSAAGSDAFDEDAGDSHGSSLGSLHAKLVVVDDRWVSIGSMNMDRRSARCNTEAAIVIDDPRLAGEVASFLERGRVAGSYTLRLRDDGRHLEWIGGAGAEATPEEPRPAAAIGFKPRLASFFLSEDLL